MFESFVKFVRDMYGTKNFIPLHEPKFIGNEKKYLLETIDSTFVSSVGQFVDKFEELIAKFTGCNYAIATVNGTSALHISLILAGVEPGDEVITQPLTFVATCNAIHYCGGIPVFVDVDRSNLGLSPDSLEQFLENNCEVRDDGCCWNKKTGRIVKACVPMHAFGLPVNITSLEKVCNRFNIPIVEDAAESLGSETSGRQCGSFGKLATLSFNGNKIITTGGGGIILTNDQNLAKRAKHLTTTAKIPHKWNYVHDEIGYNYRMPNLNAALGVAQIEVLPAVIQAKRKIAENYQAWGKVNGIIFLKEQSCTKANYWLNVMLAEDRKQRDEILEYTNANNVMTRGVWEPMHKLQMHVNCLAEDLGNTEWLADRIVNVPSSATRMVSQL